MREAAIAVGEKIELHAFTTWMANDGIARTVVHQNADVELNDAIENSTAVNSLKEEGFPLLIDIRQISSITKEARSYFSMRDRQTKVRALAFIVDKPLSRIIVNFYLNVTKPKRPTRFFSAEANALEWLKQYA